MMLLLLLGYITIQVILEQLIFLMEPEFLVELEQFGHSFFGSMPLVLAIFISLIFAPFFETLVFQFALLLAFKRLTNWIAKTENWTPSFIITSLVFALAHSTNFGLNYYGILNTFMTIAPAFFLTFLSVVEFKKANGRPILSVFILHSSFNIIPTAYYVISA